jgi:hypothetical protein
MKKYPNMSTSSTPLQEILGPLQVFWELLESGVGDHYTLPLVTHILVPFHTQKIEKVNKSLQPHHRALPPACAHSPTLPRLCHCQTCPVAYSLGAAKLVIGHRLRPTALPQAHLMAPQLADTAHHRPSLSATGSSCRGPARAPSLPMAAHAISTDEKPCASYATGAGVGEVVPPSRWARRQARFSGLSRGGARDKGGKDKPPLPLQLLRG